MPTLTETAALMATAGMILLTCFLTLTRISTGAPSVSHIDKIYHLVAFAGIVLPCARFYKRGLMWLVPILICFGGAIEMIQPHVGRDGDWLDFLADIAGIGVGLAIAQLWSRLASGARQL